MSEWELLFRVAAITATLLLAVWLLWMAVREDDVLDKSLSDDWTSWGGRR